MTPSSFVPTIGEGSDTYKGVWAERDEAENFSQKHDQELIKEEKRMEVSHHVKETKYQPQLSY